MRSDRVLAFNDLLISGAYNHIFANQSAHWKREEMYVPLGSHKGSHLVVGAQSAPRAHMHDNHMVQRLHTQAHQLRHAASSPQGCIYLELCRTAVSQLCMHSD